MKKNLLWFALSFAFIFIARSQEQVIRKDSTAMPKLEIPEMTIVGKKAITLPFARKGEIYDVNIYEVPPPDTSLLEQRPALSLPIGSLPRYDEPLVPWHASVEGSFGSFAAGHLRAFIDYKSRKWGVFGNGGFITTNGHTDHASGNSVFFQTTAHSIVSTDNEILGSFRVSGGMHFLHDKYGMFGIKSIFADRSRSNIVLDTRLGSLDRENGALDVGLSANIWSITDSRQSIENNASAVSPKLNASYGKTISGVRFSGQLTYESSSLNYDYPTQTPSLFKFGVGGQWQLTEKWFLDIGGNYYGGSSSNGGTNSLLLPFACIKWQLDRDREVSFWFRPEMTLASYANHTERNPYLSRQLVLRPERKPVNFGGSFWYNSERFSIEVNGAIVSVSSKAIEVAYPEINYIDVVDANMFIVRAAGSVEPTDDTKVTFSGTIQPSYENGNHRQLPMIPLFMVGGRGELALSLPLTVWSSLEYWSKQNIDLNGSQTLRNRFLLDIGASTTIIPRTVLSFEINNILNDAYQWWYNYIAPGRSFTLEAKVNFR